MKILLALDESTKAMDEAVRIARERGAELTALFVLDSTWEEYIGHDWLSGSNARSGFLDYVNENEEKGSQAVSAEFLKRAEGVAARVETAVGRVSREICRQAREGGYDLLVLAHPFRRGLEVVRDTPAAVLKDAGCSVLFVCDESKPV